MVFLQQKQPSSKATVAAYLSSYGDPLIHHARGHDPDINRNDVTADNTQKFMDAVIEAVKQRQISIQITPASVIFHLEKYPDDIARLRPGSVNDVPGEAIPGYVTVELPRTPGTRAHSPTPEHPAPWYGTGQTYSIEIFSPQMVENCASLIIQALRQDR